MGMRSCAPCQGTELQMYADLSEAIANSSKAEIYEWINENAMIRSVQLKLTKKYKDDTILL